VQHPKQSLSIFKSVPAKSKRERNNVDKDNRNLPLGAKFHYTLEIYVINNKKKKERKKKRKRKDSSYGALYVALYELYYRCNFQSCSRWRNS